MVYFINILKFKGVKFNEANLTMFVSIKPQHNTSYHQRLNLHTICLMYIEECDL